MQEPQFALPEMLSGIITFQAAHCKMFTSWGAGTHSPLHCIAQLGTLWGVGEVLCFSRKHLALATVTNKPPLNMNHSWVPCVAISMLIAY